MDSTLSQLLCCDQGYYSACSSLSPASSVDSCCLSPPSQLPESFFYSCRPAPNDVEPSPSEKKRQSRSKYPGKKRQSASEREKLRMRDLTKALHHLRTYLPPSVAPMGQTLTKIETLRLAIRYISYLSAQLEQDKDIQFRLPEAKQISTQIQQSQNCSPPMPEVLQNDSHYSDCSHQPSLSVTMLAQLDNLVPDICYPDASYQMLSQTVQKECQSFPAYY